MPAYYIGKGGRLYTASSTAYGFILTAAIKKSHVHQNFLHSFGMHGLKQMQKRMTMSMKIVGKNVKARYAKGIGAVELYSNNGTLWPDWVERLGEDEEGELTAYVERKDIITITVAEGTVYLPENIEQYGYRQIFEGLTNAVSIDLRGFDTSRITNMSRMFGNCKNLEALDLSSFDTSHVTNMHGMFVNCASLKNLNLGNLNTEKVTDMSHMFFGCMDLTSLDLSRFDTAGVKDMSNMFNWCRSLTSLDLSNFDTSCVTNMKSMFYECPGLQNLNLSSFNTSKVISTEYMFYGCCELTKLDLSSFDMSHIMNMCHMFAECQKLEKIIMNAVVDGNADINQIFWRCPAEIKEE